MGFCAITCRTGDKRIPLCGAAGQGEVAGRETAGGRPGAAPCLWLEWMTSRGRARHIATRLGAAGGGRGKQPCPGNLEAGGPGPGCLGHAVCDTTGLGPGTRQGRGALGSALPAPATRDPRQQVPAAGLGGRRPCLRAARAAGWGAEEGQGRQGSNEEMENFSCISCAEQAQRLEGSVSPRH